MVINWPTFNIFVSQGIGRTMERKRDGVAVKTYRIFVYQLILLFSMGLVSGAPKQLQ